MGQAVTGPRSGDSARDIWRLSSTKDRREQRHVALLSQQLCYLHDIVKSLELLLRLAGYNNGEWRINGHLQGTGMVRLSHSATPAPRCHTSLICHQPHDMALAQTTDERVSAALRMF